MAKDGIITLTEAELTARIQAGVQAALVGVMTMSNTAQAATEAQRKAEMDDYAKECQLGTEARSQRIADKMFPEGPGKEKFAVKLNDKNGQPKLVLNAASEYEAKALYEKVSGIISVDKPQDKYEIAKVHA